LAVGWVRYVDVVIDPTDSYNGSLPGNMIDIHMAENPLEMTEK